MQDPTETQDRSPAAAPTEELARLLTDRRWIVGLCRKLVATTAEAEDLVQETVARALTSSAMEDAALRTLQDSENRARRGRAWLAATARRLSGERRRGERHRGDRERAFAIQQRDKAAPLDPADALERAEFRERLARHVMELPPMEREAIVLRHYEELEYREIVKQAGAESEAAVRQRVSRGLRRLRERLDAEDAERRGGDSGWRVLALGALRVENETLARTNITSASVGAWSKFGGLSAAIAAAGLAVFTILQPASPESAAIAAPMMGPARITTAEDLAALAPAGASARVSLAQQAEADRNAELPPTEPDRLQVRVVDDATGEPIISQAWRLVRTGAFDLGGRGLPTTAGPGGPTYPNPEPIQTGTTDDAGIAHIARPEDDLVHLVTARSIRHARGSFPLEIRDGAPVPHAVRLTRGSQVTGRVVDDLGEPVAGAIVVGEAWTGEEIVMGETDETGAFAIHHVTTYAHAFRRVLKDKKPTGELRPGRTEYPRFKVWRSRDAWRARQEEPNGHSIYFKNDPAKDREQTVVLPRRRSLAGVVLDGRGHPVAGALVLLRRWARPTVNVRLPHLSTSMTLIKEKGWARAAIADEAGKFWLDVAINGLPRRGNGQLVAIGPEGGIDAEIAFELCAPLAFGEVRRGIRMELERPEFLRLALMDPSGPVRCPDRSWAAGTLLLDTGESVDHISTVHLCRDNRLEFTFWPKELPTAADGRIRGTYLLPGYEPLALDLAAEPGEFELQLKRRPMQTATVRVQGDGAPFVDSLHVEVAFLPADAPPDAEPRFDGSSTWELSTDKRVDIKPGETFEILARPSYLAYMRVWMRATYGERREMSPVLGPFMVPDQSSADGTFGHIEVNVTAPEWNPGAPMPFGSHPLLIEEPTPQNPRPVRSEADTSGEERIPRQIVEFRLLGLPGPERFSSRELLVREVGSLAPPLHTRWHSSSRVASRHRVLVAPGTYTVAPPTDSPIRFEPTEFTLPPGVDDVIALKVEIEATVR